MILIGNEPRVSGKEGQKKKSCDNENKPDYMIRGFWDTKISTGNSFEKLDKYTDREGETKMVTIEPKLPPVFIDGVSKSAPLHVSVFTDLRKNN